MTHSKTNKTTKSKQDNSETPKYVPDPKFRRFYLERDKDISGVSGVGIVAHGVQFENGSCVLYWVGVTSCVSIWHSVYEMIAVHGHENTTKIVWLDT